MSNPQENHYAQLAWIVGVFTIIVFTALHIDGIVSMESLIFVILSSIGNVVIIKLTNNKDNNLHSFHEEVTKSKQD